MKTACLAATTAGALHGTALPRTKEGKRKPNVVIFLVCITT